MSLYVEMSLGGKGMEGKRDSKVKARAERKEHKNLKVEMGWET